jgi:hypothetical protein
MNGVELINRVAELQRQYDDRNRPMRPIQDYRQRHARRHPERDYDGEEHVSQYETRQ